MKPLMRVLVIAFAALFAASTVAHAVSMTVMSVKMGLAADAGPMDMTDCDGCGSGGSDDESAAACDMICAPPFVATFDIGKAFQPLNPGIIDTPRVSGLTGYTGPPDPYPPRSLILS